MMNASWWNIHPFVFTQSLFSFQGTTLWRVLPFRKVVGSSGLEPPTSRLSGARSNHLSYEPIVKAAVFRPARPPCGGDEEVRTPDPLRARQVLSQLSYTPVSGFRICRSYLILKTKAFKIEQHSSFESSLTR